MASTDAHNGGRRSRVRAGSAIVTIGIAAALAGCGSSGTQLSTADKTTTSTGQTTAAAPTTTTTSTTATVHYQPKIDPAKFTDHITNRYQPWTPGTTHHYQGVRDGAPIDTRVTVTHQTKTIMGVRCVVVKDVVTSNNTLVEKTTDWYAQDSKGNVWYFGEDTAEYLNGVVTSTEGTWEAGVDQAQPGIVMEAHPKVGDHYRQEFRPGIAEDTATVLSVNGTAKVPAGTFHHLIITDDKNPLDPSKKEHKWFAAGIGFVQAHLTSSQHHETSKLVK